MRCQVGWLVAVVAALAVAACTSSGDAKSNVKKTDGGWFEARPQIMPGQRATTVRPDPFGSLHVPTSEDAYNTLSRAQQANLANALRSVDCAHPPHLSARADRVACDAESDVFLLGAVLFTGNDVTRAKPLPPSASVAGWQLSLSLTPAAAGKLHGWTSRHHVTALSGAFNNVQLSSTPPCGLTTTTPCADFVAYISDNVVLSSPVWSAAVGSPIAFSGDFNQALAARVAHRLTS